MTKKRKTVFVMGLALAASMPLFAVLDGNSSGNGGRNGKADRTETELMESRAATDFENNLRYETIVQAQAALHDEGFPVRVDGVIDSNMRDAIRQFQIELGMEDTGTLDELTLQALGVATN